MTEEEKKKKEDLAEKFIAQNCYWTTRGSNPNIKDTFLWTEEELLVDISFSNPEASDFFILATVPIDIFRFRRINATLRIGGDSDRGKVTSLHGIAEEVTGDLNLSFLELEDFSGMPIVRKEIWCIGCRVGHFRGFRAKLGQLRGDTDYIKSIPGYRAYSLIERVTYDKI